MLLVAKQQSLLGGRYFETSDPTGYLSMTPFTGLPRFFYMSACICHPQERCGAEIGSRLGVPLITGMGMSDVTMRHQGGSDHTPLKIGTSYVFLFTISNIWSGFPSCYNQTKYIRAGFRLISAIRILLAVS